MERKRRSRWLVAGVVLFTVAVVAFLGAAVSAVITGQQQRDRIQKQSQAADYHTCLAINFVFKTQRAGVQRQLRILPTLAYYKEHPDELQNALKQTKDYLQLFSALRCDKRAGTIFKADGPPKTRSNRAP